jgi:hypothetical protein
VGLHLLLLCERYEWVRTKLMSMTFGSSVPYGPDWTADMVGTALCTYGGVDSCGGFRDV